MYLHIGNELMLAASDIIGIFDLDKTTVSSITKKYLTAAEKTGNLRSVGEDLPKSFVVCQRGEDQTVYLSPISSGTLNIRSARPL